MKSYKAMSQTELQEELKSVQAAYDEFKSHGLKLDMSRGKPGNDQLNLSMPMLDVLTSKSILDSEGGADCRNYGLLDGIPEAKKLFSDLLGVTTGEVIVEGSSSLTIMYDTISRAYTHGVFGSDKPWMAYDKPKFLCPVPGYDRHFTITEFFNFEMINVPMDSNGPDMDIVEKLVASDESIKGIWCVPKYSNPTGSTYSDEVVRRFASMKTAAKDFRIFWDNAYCVHYIYADDPLLNILDECKKAGNPDRVFIFASTSKVTFPGAGVSVLASSENNIAFTKKQINAQTISWDKMNMLRHVRFFGDVNGIRAHMDKHAAILRPKFDVVIDSFEKELEPRDVGSWIKPNGGYFITYFTFDNCAKRVVELCKNAGVVLTGAGATHPYNKDPLDNTIRIAPSYPATEELKLTVELFGICVRLASLEALLKKNQI